MNKMQKTILSILLLAILTFSAGMALTQAATPTAWAGNHLVTQGKLTIYGSSTVGPIATEEINQGAFVNYFNGLGLGTTLSDVVLKTDGSGTAIPALAGTTGSADVGQLSRPPSTGEYGNTAMNSMQLYAVGLDSVAVVVSPDMTWFPTGLTTNQVASLFVDTTLSTSVNQGTNGQTGTTPKYVTWNDFLTANGFTAVHPQGDKTIIRAARDPTSGTFDCFNNYFGVPNGYSLIHKTGGVADGSTQMAPFTYCEQNVDIYNAVHAGNTATSTDTIGFISLGYLKSDGGMIGLNIAYNTASAPSGQTVSPIIKYYGTGGPGFPTGTTNPPTWGPAVQPTAANVIAAYGGIYGTKATGTYYAWRWLWEATPGFIPDSGETLAAGVWISYMMAAGTTNTGMVRTAPGTGTSNFVADQYYIPLERCDMAGGQVLDSNLTPYTGFADSGKTQTSSFPTGVVNFNDITYFVGAYINYNVNHVYNPYADFDANGVINFNDILGFVGQYIYYYTGYLNQ